MNALRVIHPYKTEGVWVFDDEAVGLVQEPFVSGAKAGFTLIFSDKPFPGHQAAFEWRREEYEGNWYYAPALDMEGWLCPALFKYFEAAPPKLYAQFKAKEPSG